jgi:hypothetical protein
LVSNAQKIYSGGSLRKRKDGISEYSIVEPRLVQSVCELLMPYLKLKKPQAELIFNITKGMFHSKKQNKEDFLNLCQLVDQVGELNDSKKRTRTAIYVQSEWNKLFPVETSENCIVVGTIRRDISSD